MNEQNEIWQTVENTNNFYQISSVGNLKSFFGRWGRKECIIKHQKSGIGYSRVYVRFSTGAKLQNIHRMVAKAFIPNPENKPCVNHKNGIRNDNRVENLEWCTYSENALHKIYVLNHNRKYFGIPVVKIDANTQEILKEYATIKMAVQDGYSEMCIINCCKGRKKHHHHFLWKYKKDILDSELSVIKKSIL